GEQQNRGRNSRIGLEHAAGQRDHSIELLVLDQNAPQRFVRVARSEENSVRHDDGGASARLEQTQKQRQEEQLGLLGLDYLLQVLGAALIVERSGKGRIGHHQRVFLILAGVVLGERIAVNHIRVLHSVQQHVHAADAQHSVIEVEPVEKFVMEVLPQLGIGEHFWMPLAQ